jgi:FkbM family methyltransferase
LSFDQGVIARFGAHVHAFDPTPHSVAWVSQQALPAELHFHQVGIAAVDGEIEFYAPEKSGEVSFSNAPSSNQRRAPIRAKVMRLQSIMQLLQHSQIDVLKMDIEGFEYQVIDDIFASEVRPQHLLIEFHHGLYRCTEEETRNAVTAIRSAGYRLFYVSYVGGNMVSFAWILKDGYRIPRTLHVPNLLCADYLS